MAENELVPASAGVILEYDGQTLQMVTCPRIRGGDPSDGVAQDGEIILSPHPRG